MKLPSTEVSSIESLVLQSSSYRATILFYILPLEDPKLQPYFLNSESSFPAIHGTGSNKAGSRC